VRSATVFDMEALEAPSRYKILAATVTPRPIAWVTTLSEDGVVNAAPYSFFNAMGHEPPTIAIGLLGREGRFKDTAANILATAEFVVNLVSEPNAEAMNLTCIDAPPDIDELALAGLTPVPSHKIRPPRIAESPVSFECRTLASLVTGPHQTVVIGRVLCAHVDEAAVQDKERCYIDTQALQLIGRMHGSGWYARCTDLFQMDRPSWAEWQRNGGGVQPRPGSGEWPNKTP